MKSMHFDLSAFRESFTIVFRTNYDRRTNSIVIYNLLGANIVNIYTV